MPWVRLDDGFAEHPKVREAGALALAMQVAALCYANRNLTDGYIPASIVPALLNLQGLKRTAESVAADCAAACLWDEVRGGWLIHDYAKYQPTKAAVTAEQERARERMQRHRSAHVRPNTQRGSVNVRANNAVTNGHVTEEHFGPDPVPVPKPEELNTKTKTTPSSPASQDDASAGFEDFWIIYPYRRGRKLGKAKALAVWRGLTRPKREAAARAVRHYAAACSGPGDLAKDAHRWLRDGDFGDWQEPATLTPLGPLGAGNGSRHLAPYDRPAPDYSDTRIQ